MDVPGYLQKCVYSIALLSAALILYNSCVLFLFQVVVLVLDGSEGVLRKTELSIASMGTLAASKTKCPCCSGEQSSIVARAVLFLSLPFFSLPPAAACGGCSSDTARVGGGKAHQPVDPCGVDSWSTGVAPTIVYIPGTLSVLVTPFTETCVSNFNPQAILSSKWECSFKEVI